MFFNFYSVACGLEYSVYTISVMQDRNTNIFVIKRIGGACFALNTNTKIADIQ